MSKLQKARDDKYAKELSLCFSGDALSYWRMRAELAESRAQKAWALEAEWRKKFLAANKAKNKAQAEYSQMKKNIV